MSVYYNEIDKFGAQWLRELIKERLIADGEVDERDIRDVRAADLRGFTQCHFFAGIGGWSYALRLAGWPDDRPVWTGSCPCQPFSAAGANIGGDDPRHLWPTWFQLIRQCRPSVVFGEQVAAAIKHGWLDLVFDDLEREGYAAGSIGLPACSVGAFHIRQRLWFVADTDGGNTIDGGIQLRGEHGLRAQGRCDDGIARDAERTQGRVADTDSGRTVGYAGKETSSRQSCGVESLGRGELRELADTTNANGRCGERGAQAGTRADREWRRRSASNGSTRGGMADAISERRRGGQSGREDAGDARPASEAGFWSDAEWIACRDGKARPVKPGIFPLAYGVPNRVGTLRGSGNAIVPEVAAEVIAAYMDVRADADTCPTP